MSYKVFYTDTMIEQIQDQIQHLRKERVSGATIDGWFARLFDAVDSLYEWPLRHPVAEAESASRGFEIRKLNFENYLIHYRVNESTKVVEVLSFRHAARQPE